MTYPLDPKLMYMMPTHFGPMCGPRQGPDGEIFAFERDNRRFTTVAVDFVTNPEQLRRFLPPGFALWGEPVVTVSATYMKNIDWLAGRGYNVLGVRFPVLYQGEKDRAVGPFLTVLWENLTDPILTGREQLGFSKVFCDLPEPVIHNGEAHCTASWMGFRFLDIRIRNLEESNPAKRAESKPKGEDGTLRGQIHYKYTPRTGEWGKADAQYAVISPETSNAQIADTFVGEGEIQFHKARWEDLPTQYMIVNALHELEIGEYLGGRIEYGSGGGSISNQRILY